MKKTLLFLLIFSASHVFSQNSIDWISLEQAKEKAKISNKKILDSINYKISTKLEDGLLKTYQWYLNLIS